MPAAARPAGAVCASGTPYRASRSGIRLSTGAFLFHARPKRERRRAW